MALPVTLALVLVAAALVAVYLGWLLLRHAANVYRIDKLTASMPGPRAYPIVGSFLAIAGPHAGLIGRIYGLVQRYGSTFKIWAGPVAMGVILDPDDLQVLFSHPHLSSKSGLYALIEPVIGKGLITLNGPVYKRHRKAISSSLHLDILQEFVHIFSASRRRIEPRLDQLSESGEVFNVTPVLGWNTSQTVCETVMSCDAPGLDDEKEALVKAMHNASRLMLFRALRPWYASEAIFSMSDEYRDYQEVVDGLASYTNKLFNHKLEKMNKAPAETIVQKNRRQTFLDHILTTPEGSQIKSDELLDELKTLLFAGSATSMDFQSLFFVCMALQPEVQKKVQKELDDIFGDELDREILPSDLPHMHYLECALKEVLRFFPPVPTFARQATDDVKLPSGHTIPRGMHVVVMPMLVHRDPRYFANPSTFDPDRFLPENSQGRHPFAFIPFSAGTRNCVGQRYAMMFAKTVAASVLRRYDVLPDPNGPAKLADVRLISGIALSVRGGAKIRVRRRQPPTTSSTTSPSATPTTSPSATPTAG